MDDDDEEQPQDIDHVRTGQEAFVRFSAFNQRTTPQLTGTVSYVSADTSHDQQTNAPYFTVRVTLPDDERRRLRVHDGAVGQGAAVPRSVAQPCAQAVR